VIGFEQTGIVGLGIELEIVVVEFELGIVVLGSVQMGIVGPGWQLKMVVTAIDLVSIVLGVEWMVVVEHCVGNKLVYYCYILDMAGMVDMVDSVVVCLILGMVDMVDSVVVYCIVLVDMGCCVVVQLLRVVGLLAYVVFRKYFFPGSMDLVGMAFQCID
jgi:hypothetical protein